MLQTTGTNKHSINDRAMHSFPYKGSARRFIAGIDIRVQSVESYLKELEAQISESDQHSEKVSDLF